ncbi:hypothetical protein AAHA92_13245 [Salvia divinorum]|uniref:Uncharacterized protein n=1 Tax=Salvia divinorum TaxID=28513 RepID=A0ABD1H7M6_SALDI
MKLAVVVFSILVVLGTGVDAQRLYGCWGGCYNKCFIDGRNTMTKSQKLACEYSCLNTCIPSTPTDYAYYCRRGCSLKRCRQLVTDGAKLEECFGRCTDLCSESVVAP